MKNFLLALVLFILNINSHTGMNAIVNAINVGTVGNDHNAIRPEKVDRSTQTEENIKTSKIIHSLYIQAAKDGNLNLFNELLEVVTPNFDRNQAFKQASVNGHIQIVEKLLSLDKSAGIDPFSGWNFALRYSAQAGHLEIIQRILNINHENYWKATETSWNESLQESLKMASENGHIQVVKTLLNSISPCYKTFSATFDALSDKSLLNQEVLKDNLETIFNILIAKCEEQTENMIKVLDYARIFNHKLYDNILYRISNVEIRDQFHKRVRFMLG